MKALANAMRPCRVIAVSPLVRETDGAFPGASATRNTGSAAGFTVFEMVIVLVLVGLLSIVAIPLFLNEGLRVTPAAEQIAGEIRYAQSLAMTHGEPHSFNVSGDTFSITSESGGAVPLSNGEASGGFDGLSLTMDGGGSGSVTFSSLFGQADGAHTVRVTGGGASASVSISAETGYVRVQG